MEIACVIDVHQATPPRPGRSGGFRPGRGKFSKAEGSGTPADPMQAAERTEAMVRALESIGAAVESEAAGEAFFSIDGLAGIHGGSRTGVLEAAKAAIRGDIFDQEISPRSVGVGVAPTRIAAFAAAHRRDGTVVHPAGLAGFLAPLRVGILPWRLGVQAREADELVLALERLGIETLGALAGLHSDQVADRFGPLGLRAQRLARGGDEPLRPRVPREDLAEQIELPEGTAGSQLDRALELLVDRLLAAPIRRGRTLLGLRLGARLAGGGSWSVEQGLGRPTASARALRNVLTPHLERLPGPAETLRLRALGLGPPASDQLELAVGGAEPRRRRLGEAVREVRATQGPETLLKILPVDSGSRVPERWALLTPFPEL